MDQSDSSPSMTAIAVVSLALHGLLAWGMEGGAHAVAPVHREPVRVTVRELPRPAPVVAEPEPEMAPGAAPERAAAPLSKPAVAQQRAPRKAKPIAKEVPQEPAPALDFTGVTLTSPSGGFAQIAGSGEHMNGPLGAAHAGSRHGTNPHGDGKGAAQGADLVSLGSLSRAPRAPSLDDALAANYPKSAHDLGLSGEAVVRARILPSGEVAATHVLVASAPEFGKACQRTLAGSRWSAPLDATGTPVATELSYKCVFEVTH
ncbi:MAG TPA: energy transducer TonB [Polyangiales bacterium]|nr:energy transducer TonB [Polyangiales bacterium]